MATTWDVLATYGISTVCGTSATWWVDMYLDENCQKPQGVRKEKKYRVVKKHNPDIVYSLSFWRAEDRVPNPDPTLRAEVILE